MTFGTCAAAEHLALEVLHDLGTRVHHVAALVTFLPFFSVHRRQVGERLAVASS
jgi:hypothetical protein